MAANRNPTPLQMGLPLDFGGAARPGPEPWTFEDAYTTGRTSHGSRAEVDWTELWQTEPGDSPGDQAKWLVSYFAAKGGAQAFRHIDRNELASGLIDRIDDPGLINQAVAGVCGPTSLLFDMDTKNPRAYAQFVIDLFERGAASMGTLSVTPGDDLLAFAPPLGRRGMAPADWVPMASLRDSENWFFDYESPKDEFAGITMPHELAKWFEKAGYGHVENETNVFFTKGLDNALEASRLYGKNYRVCLFINADMLKAADQDSKSVFPDHWVVLDAPMVVDGATIHFQIFTWADGHRRVPLAGGVLPISSFTKNFYGYVAAKW